MGLRVREKGAQRGPGAGDGGGGQPSSQLAEQMLAHVLGADGGQRSCAELHAQGGEVVAVGVLSVGVAVLAGCEELVDEMPERVRLLGRQGQTGLEPVLLVTLPRLGLADVVEGLARDEDATRLHADDVVDLSLRGPPGLDTHGSIPARR